MLAQPPLLYSQSLLTLPKQTFPYTHFLPEKTFQPFSICLNCLVSRWLRLNGLYLKPFSNEGLCHEMGWPFCAWKALQSEAMVTGHEVLGKKRRGRCAWNFRASERRAELVRAMPSAAENLKEEALRLWQCCKCMSNGVLPFHWDFRRHSAIQVNLIALDCTKIPGS